MTEDGIDLTIQVYSPDDATLTEHLPSKYIKVIKPEVSDYKEVPLFASRRL